MMSATNPVGSRFASLPLALILSRNLRLVGLTSALPAWAYGSRFTNHHSRVTNHCLSNRNKVRIEIAVTHSKQTTAIISNRNSFRGRPNSTERMFAATEGAKKRLIATLANSKIRVSQSQQKTSHFLTATRNTLCRFQILYPESAAVRRSKGRALHSTPISVAPCLCGKPHARIEHSNE
jgi:hypothetical protein